MMMAEGEFKMPAEIAASDHHAAKAVMIGKLRDLLQPKACAVHVQLSERSVTGLAMRISVKRHNSLYR
jgi:hypothetical protein